MKKTKKTNKLRVPYALTVYGKEEIAAVNKVLKDPTKIVSGPKVKEFESKIAVIFGKKHGIMVNSGSSANLIALSVLNIPRGSEVITPILTFATTLAPIVQLGLVPVFADVKEGSYQIDENQIESLITEKTKALMIPSLIGNIPNLEKLQQIAQKHKLFLIEDSCDTLGAKYAGKPTGHYSDVSTTSFYASHIITTAGLGGMVCFNDNDLARRAVVMANWGRESTLFGFYEESEALKKRMAGVLDGETYDAKFIFSEIGYNFQATELNGAFGLVQLKRLKKFSKIRHDSFKELMNFFKKYEKFFILPVQDKKADTNWLSFPLVLKSDVGFSRAEITKYLEEQNIQTRPIFTGNVLKQPAFKNIESRTRSEGYPIAEHVMKNGFLIGCHQGLTKKHIAYLKENFVNFLKDK